MELLICNKYCVLLYEKGEYYLFNMGCKFVGVLFCGLAYFTDIEDQIFVLQSE